MKKKLQKTVLFMVVFFSSFMVMGQNTPPTCVITAPHCNAYFKEGTDIMIRVYSSDLGGTQTGGSVTKVEFFNGDIKLGESATAISNNYTYLWKNVPAGTYRITAKATDNDNTVFTSAGVIITVGTKAAVSRGLSANKGKYLANVNSVNRSDFMTYWNGITSENGCKWGSIEGTRDVMNWTDADKSYNLARDNNLCFRYHVLAWGSQYPTWITTLTPTDFQAEMEEYMAAVAKRYPLIDNIDVLNENLYINSWDKKEHAAGTPYFRAGLGGPGITGYDWAIWLFKKARHYFPNAKLVMNEFEVETGTAALNEMLAVVKVLRDSSLIDGIGIQAHYFNLDGTSGTTIQNSLNAIVKSGLPIYVTELDLKGNPATEAGQLIKYKELFPVFWNHPAVAGITLWGYVEGSTWSAGTGLLNSSGTERSAMTWLRSFMAGFPDVGFPFHDTITTDFKSGKIEGNPKSIKVKVAQPILVPTGLPSPIFSGLEVKKNGTDIIKIAETSYHSSDSILEIILVNDILNTDDITLSYSTGNIRTTDSIQIHSFTNMYIENLLPGSSPVLTGAKSNWEGSQIELSFNKKMNLAENAVFSILNKKSNQNVGISAVSLNISDSTKYLLTLSSQVFMSDTLEISYNGTTVQSHDNGTLKTIANVPVTNLSHGKSPQLKTVIILTDNKSLKLTFDKNLNSISTQKVNFVLNVNGISTVIKTATSTYNTVVLTFATQLKYGDIISLGFENGSITSVDGGELTSITGFQIQNTILDIVATQSSTNYGGYADLAIDGNTNGAFGAGSVTHTNETLNTWWACNWSTVDSISDVTIWNRTDACCSDRLANFYVFLSQTPFASNDLAVTAATNGVWKYYHTGIVGEKIIVPVNTCGKYLRIQMAGTGTLSLAEVQISRKSGKCVATSVQNLGESGEIEVFPNPVTSGKFTIENNSDQIIESIELIDFQGRIVKTIKLNKNNAEIEVSNLEIGMYYVRIHTEKSIVCKKIIVL